MKNKLILLFFLLSGFVFLYIFHPLLTVYFVQDDFFFLSISRVTTFKEFISFFIPRSDVVWYRPLSSQVFFFLGQKLFGLWPIPYHLIVFLTHFLNGYLIFKLSIRTIKNTQIGLLAFLVYITNASLMISLAWLSTYSFVLGVTFLLLTLLFFLDDRVFLSLIFFILGVLTTEINILTIGVLLTICLIFKRKLSRLLSFIIISLIVFLLRFVFFTTTISGDYNFSITKEFFSLLQFYVLRSFGLPMLIKVYFSDIVIKWTFVCFFLVSAILSISWVRADIKLSNKKFIFFSSIYAIFLFPFLLLRNHYAPYYISFSLAGFSLILSYLLSTLIKKNKCLLFIFLFSYLSVQIISFKLTYNTHWIFKRAELSKQLITRGIFQASVGTEEYFALGANRAKEVFTDE